MTKAEKQLAIQSLRDQIASKKFINPEKHPQGSITLPNGVSVVLTEHDAYYEVGLYRDSQTVFEQKTIDKNTNGLILLLLNMITSVENM